MDNSLSPRHKASRQQELKQTYSLKEAGGLIERPRPDGLRSETLGQTQTKQNKKRNGLTQVMFWREVGWSGVGWGRVCVRLYVCECVCVPGWETKKERRENCQVPRPILKIMILQTPITILSQTESAGRERYVSGPRQRVIYAWS